MSFEKSDLAYAAGLLDGEGTILIEEQTRSDLAWPVFTLRCRIVQKPPQLIFWLRDKFGGSVNQYDSKEGKYTCWEWKLTSSNASAFLKLVFPYLKLKRSQAILAIEFQTSIADRKTVLGGNQKLAPDVIEHRRKLKRAISALNQGMLI